MRNPIARRMWPRAACGRAPLAALLLACAGVASHAQEIEPRAYSPAPTGTNFVLTGLAYSSGNVLTDPSLPVDDVTAEISVALVGYARTFGLFGRTASVGIAVPYTIGKFEGNIAEQRAQATREGFADARLRLAVNLIGPPALAPREFARREPQTTLGVSMSLVTPTGEYDRERLINIGSNRWAAKLELGVSHPVGHWIFEGAAGVWMFQDNDEFFRGSSHREQDPISSLQAHVVYVFKRKAWLAGDATFYNGGSTTIDGVARDDAQSNSRVGLTLSLPLGQRQSLKLSMSDGATTRLGADFTSYAIAWQYVWFDD